MNRRVRLLWIVLTIVYPLRVFGLAPFSIDTETWRRASTNLSAPRVFVPTKIGLAYDVLLSIAFLVLAALAWPSAYDLDYPNKSFFTATTDVVQGMIFIVTTCVILISWGFNQTKAVGIINRLIGVEFALNSYFENRPVYSKLSIARCVFHLISNAALWITLWVTEIVIYSKVIVILWSYINVPSFLVYCYIVEYLIALGLIANKFERVNDCLSDLNMVSYRTSSRLLADLKLLHKIRTTLFEVSEDLAEFFSFPILLCIACSFFNLVYNFYYLLTYPFLSTDTPSNIALNNTLSWILVALYPLVLLFASIKETIEKAKLTALIIDKLYDATTRSEIRTELRHFSLHLLHEKLHFQAYNFFTIDFNLLQSMIGATATYLAIICQFNFESLNPIGMRRTITGQDLWLICVTAVQFFSFRSDLNVRGRMGKNISPSTMKFLPNGYKNLLNFVKACVMFSKIFGLTPFSVRIETETIKNSSQRILARGGPAFVNSKFGMAYNILIIIVLVVTPVYILSGDLAIDYGTKNSMTIAIWVVQKIQAFVAAVIVIGCCGFRQKMITSITNRLLNTDVLLGSFLDKSRQVFSTSYYLAHIIFTASIWMTFVSFEPPNHYGGSKLLVWCVDSIPAAIMYIFTVKYAIIVGSIARELKNFNEILSEFDESINDDESTNPRNSAAGLYCYASLITRRNNYVSPDRLASLKLLHAIRNTLTEISIDVRQYFSFPITHCMIAFFVAIVTHTYAITTNVLSEEEKFSLDDGILKAVCRLCIVCYPMILLFENVRRTLKRANTTGHVIHTLLRRSNQRDIRTELEQFSCQLLHEKIKFTANGLFSLDYSLLHSMVGATTTYLVILMQFNDAGTEKNFSQLSEVERFENETTCNNDNNHAIGYIRNDT
ncbi:uncharacterized protein LOC125500228 [Athalia rosae]|uniref:uncharacterized protein LOC125500228 n=1 Tax=Athalia rosae TaxID=37344 RepID=UPI0020338CAD|nr:uncharacterized protein LOC125500228 [Athalia rosae]